MRVRSRALLALITSLSMLVAPSLAAAACPTADSGATVAPVESAPVASAPVASAPTESAPVEARAAGDDPVVTPPTDPTCDGAGYDAEFPDIPLVADEIAGGGATQPTGYLPVTGIAVIPLALLGFLGLVLLVQGACIHRLARAGRS